MTPHELAVKFHEIYERLAPSFGYETRLETRAFDPETPNGRLMIAVCAELIADRAQATEAGWQLVPKEPTREMILAGKHTLKGAADFTEGIRAECAYKSMLKAAPAQESEGEG